MSRVLIAVLLVGLFALSGPAPAADKDDPPKKGQTPTEKPGADNAAVERRVADVFQRIDTNKDGYTFLVFQSLLCWSLPSVNGVTDAAPPA